MSDYSALKSDGKILQLLDGIKTINGLSITDSQVLEFLNAVKSLGGVTSTDLWKYLVQEGKVYTVRKVISITAGSSNVELWFNIDTYTKSNLILLPPSFAAVAGGPIRVDVYFGAQKQGGTGTEITSFNRNANYVTSSEAKVFITPTATTAGVIGPQFLIKSTDATVLNSGSGDNTLFDIPYIFSPSEGPLPSNARAVINHLGTEDAVFEYLFIWAEI